jgi:hypothetical protein
MKGFAAVLLVGASLRALAQSTSGLVETEPVLSARFGVGAASGLVWQAFGQTYGEQAGEARAAAVQVQWLTAGAMVIHLDGWMITRPHPPRTTMSYSYNYQTGTSQSTRLESSWLLAGIIDFGFPLHLTRSFSVEPMLGVGLVPVARGATVTGQIDNNNDIVNGARGTRSASGSVLPALGLAIRWRRLSVEQHILQVSGADAALISGENAPLVVSYRFLPW